MKKSKKNQDGAAITKPKFPRAPAGRIAVTEDISKSAEQRNSSHCGIAEAIALAYPWARSIAVDLQTIRFSNPEKRLRYIYLTPRIAQKYIVSFDQGEKAGGMSFKLMSGHVLPMAGYSEKARETKKAYYEKNKETHIYQGSIKRQKQKAKYQRAVLLSRGSDKGYRVPERFGGLPPPVAPGRRREFGLRALTR